MKKLLRYPYVTSSGIVEQPVKEKSKKYDPYSNKSIGLLQRAYSAKADSLNTEYSLNESTWD